MGLTARLLPERLPRQIVFAGDRHAEIIAVARGRIARRAVIEGASLAAGQGWERVMETLRPEDTGLVFSSTPFIFNFFEFDKLPWKKSSLRGLVEWRLQKIFPEDTAAFEHRFFRLDRTRVLSVLTPRSLAGEAERIFRERGVPLTYIGSSTLQALSRLQGAKTPPDFVVESDGPSCTMLFQRRRSPIYIRKFRAASAADAADEMGKTVAYVRGQYGVDPRRYWLLDYRDGSAGGGATPPGEEFTRLGADPAAPHLPGSR